MAEWLPELRAIDKTLDAWTDELYAALNADLHVLAAVGARTVFDRAAELLQVGKAPTFGAKLDRLTELHWISPQERESLATVIEAGSAAAHRGWRPDLVELATMMDILEAFLHRSFVIGPAAAQLRATVPARQKRTEGSAEASGAVSTNEKGKDGQA